MVACTGLNQSDEHFFNIQAFFYFPFSQQNGQEIDFLNPISQNKIYCDLKHLIKHFLNCFDKRSCLKRRIIQYNVYNKNF